MIYHRNMSRTIKISLIILSVLFGLTLMSPWVLYYIGLSNVVGRPEPARGAKISMEQSTKLWQAIGEKGPLNIEKLNPYRYVLLLAGFGSAELRSGEKAAWLVASDYNRSHLKRNRMSDWHLSGMALTIWLTRNWTTEEIIAKAGEIYNARH